MTESLNEVDAKASASTPKKKSEAEESWKKSESQEGRFIVPLDHGWNAFFDTPGLFNEDINTIHTTYRDINDKEAVLRELKNLLAKMAVRKALYDNFVMQYLDGEYPRKKELDKRRKCLAITLRYIARHNLKYKEGRNKRAAGINGISDWSEKEWVSYTTSIDPQIKCWKQNFLNKLHQLQFWLCRKCRCCMNKERFERHLKYNGSVRSVIGWNNFLGVSCFEGDDDVIRSDFNDHKALLSELTELLQNEAVLNRMYTEHLRSHRFIWGRHRKQIEGRKQIFVEHILKMAKFNLKVVSGEIPWLFKYDTPFSDMTSEEVRDYFNDDNNPSYYSEYPFPEMTLFPPAIVWKHYCTKLFCCLRKRKNFFDPSRSSTISEAASDDEDASSSRSRSYYR